MSRIQHFIDLTVFDANGESVGTVTDVINDPETLEPRYLTVRTRQRERLTGEHLLPVALVEHQEDRLSVPFEGELVSNAPTSRDHIVPDTQFAAEVADHYGA